MHNEIAPLTVQLTTTLERFERASSRCSPDYAERVRRHLLTRLQKLGADVPIVVPLDEPDAPLDLEPDDLEDLVESGSDRIRRAVLVVGEGTLEETVVPLDGALTVGRGGQTDLKVRGDNKVSRYHCRFDLEDSEAWVVDLQSANGTLVNGEMLVPEQPRRLFGGEELIVGNTFLRFRMS